MEPHERVINACELQFNILGELLPNLQTQQSEKLDEFAGARREPATSAPPQNWMEYTNLPKKTGGPYRQENYSQTNKRSNQQRGGGRGRGRKTFSERGNQAGPSTLRDEPKSEPKIEEEKGKGEDVKPIEKKLEAIKISKKEIKVNSMPYNLRGTTSGASKYDDNTNVPDKVTVPADDKSEEEIFKKPDLANITIAQLMPLIASTEGSSLPLPNINLKTHVQGIADPMPTLTISSPVAGGNLKAKKKTIVDSMPCSPPSSTSTMSSVDMSAKLREVCDTPKEADGNKSILKTSGASVEILEKYEDLTSSKLMRPYPGTQEEYSNSDKLFLPVSLSMGQEYLFVTSQTTNQVKVFLDGKEQGVLKLNDCKYFASVRNVHTILRSNQISQVVVLDNEGFHFFVENGLYIRSVLSREGFKYRGLGHIQYEGKLCLVSLFVNGLGGTEIVIIDVESESPTDKTIIKRWKIAGTDNIPDVNSKCRFLAVTPDEKKVYVTSMMLNKIFSVDLLNGECKTFDHGIKEPAGIAIDPKIGTVFVSSRVDKSVEAFNSDLGYLGKFLALDMMPVGLCVHKEKLYSATMNANTPVIKVPIKYK